MTSRVAAAATSQGRASDQRTIAFSTESFGRATAMFGGVEGRRPAGHDRFAGAYSAAREQSAGRRKCAVQLAPLERAGPGHHIGPTRAADAQDRRCGYEYAALGDGTDLRRHGQAG